MHRGGFCTRHRGQSRAALQPGYQGGEIIEPKPLLKDQATLLAATPADPGMKNRQAFCFKPDFFTQSKPAGNLYPGAVLRDVIKPGQPRAVIAAQPDRQSLTQSQPNGSLGKGPLLCEQRTNIDRPGGETKTHVTTA